MELAGRIARDAGELAGGDQAPRARGPDRRGPRRAGPRGRGVRAHGRRARPTSRRSPRSSRSASPTSGSSGPARRSGEFDDDRSHPQREGRGHRARRRARVPRHPVRGAARSGPAASCRPCAKTPGTACATRRASRPEIAQADLPIARMLGSARRRLERRRPLPQRVDARVRRRAPAGDGVDPRRRVRVRLGRGAVVRRHALRAARRRRRRHDQLPARAARLPAPRRPVRRRRSRAPATPGILDQVAALEWVRDSIAGVRRRPRRRHDLRRVGRRQQRRHAARGCPRRAGLFHKAIAQSGAGAWVSTTASAPPTIARAHARQARRAPGDIEALQALPLEQTASPRSPASATSVDGERRRRCRGSRWSTATCCRSCRSTRSRPGTPAGVHLLTGTNEHEMTLFQVLDPTLAELDDAGIVERLARVADRPARAARTRTASSMPDATAPRAVVGARDRRRVPHPRDPARRGAGRARPGVDVPLHVGDAGVRRRAAVDARARDPVRVRHPRPARRRRVHRRRPGARRRSPTRCTGRGSRSPATGDPGWPAYEPTRRATMRFDAEIRGRSTTPTREPAPGLGAGRQPDRSRADGVDP